MRLRLENFELVRQLRQKLPLLALTDVHAAWGLGGWALIAIGAAPDARAVDAAWRALDACALVVFVSPNAVDAFFGARPAGCGWPDGTRAASVASRSGPSCPAAAASWAGLKEAARRGLVDPDWQVVALITGNGLKTLDAVNGHVGKPREIKPSLREFEAMMASEAKVSA